MFVLTFVVLALLDAVSDCEDDHVGDSVLTLDHTTPCDTSAYWLTAGFCIAGLVLFSLLGPIWLLRSIRQQQVFPRHLRYSHERYVRMLEVEYTFGISDTWARDHVWIWSSFKRSHVYDRPLYLLMAAALLVLYSTARDSITLQAALMFTIFLIWALRDTISQPYRCRSTNWLHLGIVWTFVANSFFGLLRANNLQSAIIIVDSEYTQTMRVINSTALAILGVILGLAFTGIDAWPKGVIKTTHWRALQQEATAEDNAVVNFHSTTLPASQQRSPRHQTRILHGQVQDAASEFSDSQVRWDIILATPTASKAGVFVMPPRPCMRSVECS